MSETYLWITFAVIFVLALAFDLFLFQRKAHAVPVREALTLTAFWIGLALAFNIVLYFTKGPESGLLFTTAYLIEYSLSIDILFVFLAIFTYFAVPREAQRKVLLWGILGAIFFRGVFIFAGIELIDRFHFVIYLLGAFLVFTAVRLVTQKEKEVHPERNPVVRLVKKFFQVTHDYEGSSFFKKVNGVRFATPLFIVLIAIESTDIMFAVDSVPAVLAVTRDPLIVYSSNLFALLGLRALFFALAGIFYLFRYLQTGVCIVLGFVGVKMLLSDIFHIPAGISLAVIGIILGGAVALSLLRPHGEKPESPV